MKYLSNYMEEAQTKLFDECGVFFAFSNDQFTEGCEKVGADKDNKVSSFGHGGYVLSKNLDKLIDGLNNTHDAGVKQDIEENGISAIIQRELGNYEVQISGDLEMPRSVLKDYGVTEEMLQKEYKIFYQNCIDNDWF